MKLIKNASIVTPLETLEPAHILYDSKIQHIETGCINEHLFDEIIDATGKLLLPGFIELHMHGCMGHDIMEGDVGDIVSLTKHLPQFGVTRFLASTITMEESKIKKALHNIKSAMKACIENKEKGAVIEGVYLEGPFISKTYPGCHNISYIQPFNLALVNEFADIIKIITLAPEEQKHMDSIKKLSWQHQIILSLGHTAATYNEVMLSIEKGITHATHLFNAMTGLNHREPGAVGASLTSDITVELIADMVHIHPSLYQIVLKCKGTDKIILVTDSMCAAGMPEGVYRLGGQEVIVDKHSARLRDGTLAGSILTLNKGLHYFYSYSGVKLHEAVNMVSLNPAKVLKINDRTGSIEKGKSADFVLTDKNFNVFKTIIEGETVYNHL